MSAKNSPEKKSSQKPISQNNLRQIRINKNPKMSQWMLALKSGVAQSRISLIENHLISPVLRDCEKLASALNTDSPKIFPNSDGIEVPFHDRQLKNIQPEMVEGTEEINPLENL